MFLLFNDEKNITFSHFIFRLILFIFILFYSWNIIGLTLNAFDDPDTKSGFLHIVNLIFHEAGHVIFSFFGVFITSLGGTLMQLIIPITCMFVLLKKTKDPFGGSICFWWIGENFLDISVYMNDAERMWLPLIGGRFGHSSPYGVHDWNYILNELGILRFDQILAKFVFFIGILIMIISFVWSAILLINHFNLIKKKII